MEKTNNVIIPIVLAGGNGTRLWPISTSECPKQFCNIFDKDTLFQNTLKRINNFSSISDPVIICNQQHINFVREQALNIGIDLRGVIIEPFGRNTAPAVTLSALAIEDTFRQNISTSANNDIRCQRSRSEKPKYNDFLDPILLILPADHAILDIEAFQDSINIAFEAAQLGYIVCFGIPPRYPEIGYGYIKYGHQLTNISQSTEARSYIVDRFVEKPSLEVAKKYLDSGEYFWNSGMLMFKRSVFLEEIKKYANDIYLSCMEILNASLLLENNVIEISRDMLLVCRSESIDKAMMEHTNRAIVVSLDARWTDLGSFASLEKYLKNKGYQ